LKLTTSILASAGALALVAPAVAQFSVSGPGGTFVNTATAGNRCTILPTLAGSYPLTNPVPSCATSITSVTLVGLTHTFAGDVHVVLTNPAGTGYSLLVRLAVPAATCTTFGFSDNLGSNYTIVAAADPYLDSFWPVAGVSTSNVIPGGLYGQYYGGWVDGSSGVFNTDLASIPAMPGVWTLNVYDGAGGDTGGLVSWCMDGGTSAGQFASGLGGAIPAVGTGGGVGTAWPNSLPPSPAVFPLSAPVTSSCGVLRGITLGGLTHSWAGDVHVVLESPSLVRYNLIHRLGFMALAGDFGHASTFLGNTYNIADPSDPNLNAMWPAVDPNPGNPGYPNGNYPQYFGNWPTGAAGITNTPLNQIPIESGTWTLYVYDWASPDGGTLANWSMTIVNPVVTNVCDGNLNTTGAPAVMTTTGSVSLAQNFAGGANEMILHVEQLPLNVFGYFVMGNACNQVVIQNPLSQGVVCVGGRTVRGLGNQIVSSGLTGTVTLPAQLYNLPGNNGFPTGLPAVAGQRIYTQFWFRDNNMGMPGSNLSNALFFIVRP